MKPIIVTYSNESWVMMGVGWLSMSQLDGSTKEIPNSGHHICESLTSPPKFKNITSPEIKLIARPKKTNR